MLPDGALQLVGKGQRQDQTRKNSTGDLPPLPGIFPDYRAPVVRVEEGERELTMMRWGMPGSKVAGDRPVTDIPNILLP